jgi:Polysaccharide pyruvyl transferase
MSRVLFPFRGVSYNENYHIQRRFASASIPIWAQDVDYGNSWSWNTGNIFIVDALMRQLDYEAWSPLVIPARRDHYEAMNIDFAEINRNFDYCVVKGTSFINEYEDHETFADFFERIDIPCIIVGLGAQASDYRDFPVPPITLRLLKLLSEKTKTLGVRGHFTASLLEKNGIHNLDVIGCPTMYWNGSSDFQLMKPTLSRPKKFGITVHYNVSGVYCPDFELARQLQVDLLNTAIESANAMLLVQGHPFEFFIARQVEERLAEAFDKYFDYFKVDNNANNRRFFLENTKMFFDCYTWAEYIKSLDFVTGLRMHGNMIAFQNQVPTLWMIHDARTKELCEFANLPGIDLVEAAHLSLEELYERTEFAAFNRSYKKRFDNYVNFLNKNDVKHRLS